MGNPMMFFMFNPVVAWWLTTMATPAIMASMFTPPTPPTPPRDWTHDAPPPRHRDAS